MRAQEPISRAEAARRLSLSKPTVSVSVNKLMTLGLLKEIGNGTLPAGRSPRLLGFNARFALVAGVDLGASKLHVALADLNGTIMSQHTTKTPDGVNLATTLADVVRQQATGETLARVVLGTPGVAQNDRIRYAPNLPALEAPDFIERLRARLGCPLEVHNDVKLAAFGETAGGHVESVAFLAIGTGLGTAATMGTQIWTGNQGRAGEIGYLPYPSPVGTTLEGVLSGGGLEHLYTYFGGHGTARDALERKDNAGLAACKLFFDALTQAIVILCVSYDPCRIVIGGGVGLHLENDLKTIGDRVAEKIPFDAPLEISRFGDLATQRGAILLALKRANQELIA